MSADLEFATVWGHAADGAPEERATIADLSIILDGEVLTRVHDSWSDAVRPSVRVSAFPLAVWFASSWWRLRWEASHRESLQWKAGVHWKMSHDLPAAGGGYVWPFVRFDSDGEGIAINCFAARKTPSEPVQYLTESASRVGAAGFESAVDGFIGRVLARLDEQGVSSTVLHEAWQTVCAHRADAAEARICRLEAQLGFDAGEAREGVLQQFLQLQARAGEQATLEVAAGVSGGDVTRGLAMISDVARTPGVHAKVPARPLIDGQMSGTPWGRGRALARAFRVSLTAPRGPLPNETLASALELDPGELKSGTPSTGIALGLGVRDPSMTSELKLHFSKRSATGRRFEAARFLVDAIAAPRSDGWLPVTDARTARQRVQRAFAAELLIPIQEIQDELNGDFSEEACQVLAEKYEVSPWTVQSQLAKHGLIQPRSVSS